MSTTKSNIVKKKALREAQLDTLEKIASVVGETAGPAGSYVMILNEASNNVFTKDGHKVLSNIKFLQPLERSIMEEVNSSTGYIVKTVGDGTTAMTKMAYQVFARLCEYEEQHQEIPRHTIINSFKEAIKNVQDAIKANSRDLTLGDVYKICMIATDGNKEVSSTIADIYNEYDAGVFIELGISNTEDHTIEAFDGMTINRGYPSPAFINTDRGVCEINNPRLYCFTDPVDDDLLIPFVGKIIFDNITGPITQHKEMIPTVIMAPSISRDMGDTLAQVEQLMYGFSDPSQKPPLCIITGFSLDLPFYQDLIMLTGAPSIKKYINKDIHDKAVENGDAPSMENISEFYGTCERIICDNLSTSFINPKEYYKTDENGNFILDEDGNKIIGGKYNELVNWLKAEIKHSEDNNVDIPTVNGLKRRLHSLESNYVKYSIGGIASSDRDAVKDLAEDAILSCRSAANNGVGYGANFEGLIASSKCISNSIIDGKTGIELDMYKIIYGAFREVVLTLYKSVLGNGAEEELEASMKIHFQPINLRDLEYKNDVLCSIETDIAILEAISRIETMIFNTTQCLLFRPTDNVYLSDEEINKMK